MCNRRAVLPHIFKVRANVFMFTFLVSHFVIQRASECDHEVNWRKGPQACQCRLRRCSFNPTGLFDNRDKLNPTRLSHDHATSGSSEWSAVGLLILSPVYPGTRSRTLQSLI